jgi:CBS-domain-containing membrane protein
MQVFEVMTPDVVRVTPEVTLMDAARTMRHLDIGPLPVCDGDRLLGMVTDRDITVRGVAEGMVAQEALVADVMTDEARWCNEDDLVEDVLAQLGDAQVRRLPVLGANHQIVGIVALADFATRQSTPTDETLREISSPDH